MVFEIFEKGQILRPFSGLAPSKLKFFSNKKLMVAYVHIEYSTYQFSEESEGGGIHSHPRSLRYPKKRGPEGVKGVRSSHKHN